MPHRLDLVQAQPDWGCVVPDVGKYFIRHSANLDPGVPLLVLVPDITP